MVVLKKKTFFLAKRCEYVCKRCDGKLMYYLTDLPSDAVQIMNLKCLVGRIRKGLCYNPKIHEIYRKQMYPVDDVFNYRVVDDEFITITSGQLIPTSHLYKNCEKLYNK